MAERRCPYCGELVPSNSITCPKCYKRIPNEPEPVSNESVQKKTRGGGRSRTIALILSLVPALVGLLGLGLIYRNPKGKFGWFSLAFGIMFFVAALFLTMGGFTVFLAVPCWIFYAIIFLACLALVVLDNLFVRLF